MTRLLTNEDIAAHVGLDDCLDALERMFEELGRDRAITSSREDVLTPVRNPPPRTTPPVYHGLKTMSGVIPELEVGAIRINSDVINWPEYDGKRVREKVPAADGRYTGLVWLFSTRTGEPLAIFPDGLIQSYRVGATSALGAKYLAPEAADSLALLGSGFQAEAHLRALDLVRDLETVSVYSPRRESRETFAREMRDEVSPAVRPVSDPETAVSGASIVQCATNATAPVFEFEWLAPDVHVGIIRSHEAPPAFFDSGNFATLAQSWSPLTQLEEIGEQLTPRPIPAKNVNNYVVEGTQPVPRFENYTEGPSCDWENVVSLGELVASGSSGRDATRGPTGFINEGMGIQFAAVGRVVHGAAEENDLGRHLPTELLTEEYHP